jgi:uncharacterized protein (DUF1499 family)
MSYIVRCAGVWLKLGLLSGIVVLSVITAPRAHPSTQIEQKRLAPCPDTPNCVSTYAVDEIHAIAPMRYVGSRDAAKARLLDIIEAMPRSMLVEKSEDYLRVEFRTRIFRFVDDVEFLIDDDDKLIHYRAAARLGRSDLGVNRRRMERIHQAFLAQN